MNARLISKMLIIDDVPMEMVLFDSGTKLLKMTLEKESSEPATVWFQTVVAFRYEPSVMVDRRQLYVDGEYIRSVLLMEGSSWLVELRAKAAEQSESLPSHLQHFVIPSDDGVWEILAETFGGWAN